MMILLCVVGFTGCTANQGKSLEEIMMFLKDETNKPFEPQKNIRIAFSEQTEGLYRPPSAPIMGNFWQKALQLSKNKALGMSIEIYRDHRFGMVTLKDLKHWQDISEQLQFLKRQGMVLCFKFLPMCLKN